MKVINSWALKTRISKKRSKCIKKIKNYLKIIEDLLSSDVKFEELINKVSKLSGSYKHKLSKLSK